MLSLVAGLVPKLLMGLVIMRVLQKLCVELLRTFDDFSSFLSSAATTPHEFITTGDFNIQLDCYPVCTR